MKELKLGPPSSDVQSTVSSFLPCPIQSLPAQVAPIHHQPKYRGLLAFSSITNENQSDSFKMIAHLFLELLVDCIQSILDRYAFQVPCSDFKPQWEVQVNLLDRRLSEHLFEDILLIKGGG